VATFRELHPLPLGECGLLLLALISSALRRACPNFRDSSRAPRLSESEYATTSSANSHILARRSARIAIPRLLPSAKYLAIASRARESFALATFSITPFRAVLYRAVSTILINALRLPRGIVCEMASPIANNVLSDRSSDASRNVCSNASKTNGFGPLRERIRAIMSFTRSGYGCWRCFTSMGRATGYTSPTFAYSSKSSSGTPTTRSLRTRSSEALAATSHSGFPPPRFLDHERTRSHSARSTLGSIFSPGTHRPRYFIS
jgi:hypothetical protein